MRRIWLFLVMVLCLAFAVRTLLLIDATALWSDELYSVGKSFQSSFTSMLAMLREDTHPPAYYALLWLWGHLVGQSPIGLRSLSWLAYLAGGMVMVRQAMALGPVDARVKVGTVAALLAFCSPYPIRFAIEGKSYSLWVLPVALAWIVYAANYLFSSRAASWIGPPDYAIALNLNRLGRGFPVGVLASCWPVVGGQVFPNWILLWEECVNRISSVWSANAPLALWSVMARGPVCSISAIVWKLPWVGSHRIPSDPVPWGDADDLEKRLAVPPWPSELWLASSGPPPAMERKIQPLQSQVVQAGYRCEEQANDLSHARLLRCRSEAMGRSE